MQTVKFIVLPGGIFESRDSLLQRAADAATAIGPERLINISYEEKGLVTIWYWAEGSQEKVLDLERDDQEKPEVFSPSLS
jgi:hypothetical protein